MLFAEKLAQEKGIVVPDEATSSAAMATWIDANQVKKRGKSRRKAVNAQTKVIAPKTKAPGNRSGKLAANVTGKIKPPTATRESLATDTPLRIPYRNKDVALKLGARYRAGQWYAPPGVDLAAFCEYGWLAPDEPRPAPTGL
jgi:DNA topoisomerase-3